MKTRTGFVSNSSSSSFIIVGVQKSTSDAWKMVFENHAQAVYDYCSKHEDLEKEIMEWDDVKAETLSVEAIQQDEMIQEAIINLDSDWEISYCLKLGNDMGLHNGGEYDDEMFLGYYMGSPYSCTEDVTRMITEAAAKYDEVVKNKTFGDEKPAIYSVYSGY